MENQKYDVPLKQIGFFGRSHPEYLPFIGEKYDGSRILQIGESHFIPQSRDAEDRFPIGYFGKWWTDPCSELKQESTDGHAWVNWFNTRSVVADYLSGSRTRSHAIFTEMVKVFAQVCQGRTVRSITTEESRNYQHFAFMNFFQIPALYQGMKLWDSLLCSAEKSEPTKKLAHEYASRMWDTAAEMSSKIADQVIDILEPAVIIFTSNSAWGAYSGKYKDARNIIAAVHPGCRYWRNPSPSQTGREQLISRWTEIRTQS